MSAFGSESSATARTLGGFAVLSLHSPRLQLPAPPPAGRGSGAGGDAWGRRRRRGRRLPVPAFRGRLPSPRRSPSRGQGRGDVQFGGVRGVQPLKLKTKQNKKTVSTYLLTGAQNLKQLCYVTMVMIYFSNQHYPDQPSVL